jgi:thiamine-monophosphate kinase
MSKNTKRTEIADLGEFGLIDHIKKQFEIKNEQTLKGIGDDAAVIGLDADKQLLVSTDMLVEGIHFDLAYMPLKHLGYKAVVVNLSDIVAMNAVPQQITVSLALSNRFSLEAVDELYEGINLACKKYNIDLIGGDTTSSRGGLVISITAIGQAKKEDIVYRNTAKENDILCVTGDLGAAFVGLQILEREKEVFLTAPTVQPELGDHQYAIGRQLKPECRTDIIEELAKLKVIPTSMIDISDGLASEIMHICTQSNLGAIIFEEHLPIVDNVQNAAVTKMSFSPLTCILNGGEDYELLFTISQADYKKIEKHPDINVIGYMKDISFGRKLQMKSEQIVDIKAQGWQHF